MLLFRIIAAKVSKNSESNKLFKKNLFYHKVFFLSSL